MTSTLGIGVGVPTVSPDELRVNTKSSYDFVYWAGKFISSGVPSDYTEVGPETDGVSLITWALSQVGVGLPDNYSSAVTYLEGSKIPVEQAFRTRGALLVCYNRISISAGLDNIIDVVDGRYFMYKAVFSPQTSNTCRRIWQYGALVPELIYK
jgi:hypothetical protein